MFKGGMAALGTILSYMAGNFTPLLLLLAFFEAADYITGMYAGYCAQKISSQTALKGFFKKVFYFFLVGVGFGMDFMVHTATMSLGVDFAYPAMFGIFSIYYLLSTELISILENLAKIGVEIPLLTRALKGFRKRLEDLEEFRGLKEDEDD